MERVVVHECTLRSKRMELLTIDLAELSGGDLRNSGKNISKAAARPNGV